MQICKEMRPMEMEAPLPGTVCLTKSLAGLPIPLSAKFTSYSKQILQINEKKLLTP